jgi:hypothetical protein
MINEVYENQLKDIEILAEKLCSLLENYEPNLALALLAVVLIKGFPEDKKYFLDTLGTTWDQVKNE